eukprot:m.464849 g.464849  ORF g.464849 m.464849 type:complete len:386 (+) comp23799_c0_seq1:44-1201(+)
MSLLEAADCVGFDIDHTLARYKNDALGTLIFESLTRFLCESRGHPAALLEARYDPEWVRRGAVWDLRSGDLVVVGERQIITEGWHGNEALSEAQLAQHNADQGAGGTSRATELFTALERFTHNDADAVTFPTHFEVPATQVIRSLIHVSSAARGDAEALRSLRGDLGAAFEAAFNWKHFEADSGLYMRSLKRDATKYVVDRVADGTKQWLKDLRDQGKRIFALTNSNDDYAALIMETAFGHDWRDLFDLILCRANKRRGFFAADPNRPLFLAPNGEPIEELQLAPEAGKEFLVGHVTRMQKLVHDRWGCSSVVFYGDHLEADIHLPGKVTKWAPVVVAEELEEPKLAKQLCHCADGQTTQFWALSESRAVRAVADVKNTALPIKM